MIIRAYRLRALAALAAPLLLSAPAAAQSPADRERLTQQGEAPRRHSILITYGEDVCPESTGDEIIVCAQRPESERYRIPKELRAEAKKDSLPTGGSWASQVEAYDDIARIGRPNSCSAVGSFGATGCSAAALRQWHAERRAN